MSNIPKISKAIFSYAIALIFLFDAIQAQRIGITWLGFVCFVVFVLFMINGIISTMEHFNQKHM